MVEISEELAQNLINYLQTQPYNQVYRLIGELMKAGQSKNGKKAEVIDDGQDT